MADGSLRRRLTWLVLAGALVAGLASVAARAFVPSDGARIAFYAGAWSAEGVRIAPIDRPAGDLRAGDRIEAVNGRSMETWLRDALDPAVARPAARASYQLRRDGAELTTEVAWSPPALGATLLEGWSVVVLSLATAGLAAWVFARRPDEPAATALVLGAAGIAGSSVPWFLGPTVSGVVLGWPFVLDALVTGPLYMVLWPAGIHLALTFPAPAEPVRRRRWLIPAVYATTLGAYLALTVASALAAPTALEWVGSWPLAQLAVVVPSLSVATAVFVIRYLAIREPGARARVRLASLGLIASAGLGLVTFMAPTLLTGGPLLPEAAIGLVSLPAPLGLAYAIVHDRLFDLEVAINRSLVYGGLTLGVLATYAVAVASLTLVVGLEQGYGASLLATGLATLVALPLRDALQRAVNRMLYGQRDEPWQVMRRLGARLEWATDPDRAFPAVAETVADALRLPYVALEVTDEVGRPIVVARHGAAPRVTESLPLVHGGDAVGRLVLGLRSGERAFRAQELALLQDLARQAGAAIHAQRLRHDLARSRERLVLGREEERRRLRRDLHDGLGPALAAIAMRAEAATALLASRPEDARRELGTMGQEIRDVLTDVRRLVDGLRPPSLDQLGLAGAISEQAARLHGASPRGELAIAVESTPDPLPELPAAVEVAAYRIAVEALANAVRHAGARSCCVRLVADERLTVEVTDDGRGIEADARPGTGLESMRERAAEVGGDVALEDAPGGGTVVRAWLPLRASPAA